jgi:hypothetical protein
MTATERPGPKPEPSALSGGTLEGASEILAEAVKPIGALMTQDHRYYWNGRGPLTSVTTALTIIKKEAVEVHNTNKALEALMVGWAEGWLDEVNDPEAIKGWARAQPRYDFEDAGVRGTSVHTLANLLGASEAGATGFEIAEWQIPYARGFQGFLSHLRASQGQILSSEHAVFNLADGYAGTYDLILDYLDQVWLVDIKTSKGYYPEFGLQLAAYGRAQFVGLEGDPTEYPIPHIDRYAVLHLRPELYAEGWALVEYPVTGRDYVAFLAALDLYQWQKEGRFTKSILNKQVTKGQSTTAKTDPLTTE